MGEQIRVDSFQNSLKGYFENDVFAKTSYLMIQATDRFQILCLSEGMEKMDDLVISHALEIRLFSEDGEVKWARDSIADDGFICREQMKDQELTADVDYWDEEQYLDIDTTKSKVHTQEVVTTGGGRYTLPVIGQEITNFNDLKIVIRNYLDYEEDTGRAFVCDWRVVGFAKEK